MTVFASLMVKFVSYSFFMHMRNEVNVDRTIVNHLKLLWNRKRTRYIFRIPAKKNRTVDRGCDNGGNGGPVSCGQSGSLKIRIQKIPRTSTFR